MLICRRPTGGPSTELWDFGSPPRATVPRHFMAFPSKIRCLISGFPKDVCLFNPQVAHRKIAGELEEERYGLHFLKVHRHGPIIKSSTWINILPSSAWRWSMEGTLIQVHTFDSKAGLQRLWILPTLRTVSIDCSGYSWEYFSPRVHGLCHVAIFLCGMMRVSNSIGQN